jgi:hypothetical protein
MSYKYYSKLFTLLIFIIFYCTILHKRYQTEKELRNKIGTFYTVWRQTSVTDFQTLTDYVPFVRSAPSYLHFIYKYTEIEIYSDEKKTQEDEKILKLSHYIVKKILLKKF